MAIDLDYLQSLFDLKQQVVVLTGGLGKLGTNYAETLVRANARVAIFDISEKPNERLDSLAKSFPLLCLKVDVTQEAEVQAAFDEVIRQWSVPTILINNAGWKASPNQASRASVPFETYPIETWEEVFRMNLTSAVICSKIMAQKVIAANTAGTIVNIASHYALVSPDQRIYAHRERTTGRAFVKDASYGASKAAMLALTRDLATQWAPKGIRVVALSPGGVLSPQGDMEFTEKYTQRTPMGRMANENEYNRALLFLVTDTYSTGSNVLIDGGYTAW
jgi:NAD(P)-dependent dehydrogenase (short-subunit alcohol dehydrogenase family)